MAPIVPYIPETITVHLGAPDAGAENVTVSFSDYVKNVLSSEVYPTWEPAALRANALAVISFALNRVYTEYYRSRGYPFDITSSTAIDQKFINGRNIYENISALVDELFTDYLRRQGYVEPLAAKFCNGVTTTCDGLSQWGSQELAQAGADSVRILRRYYGEDVQIVTNAPVQDLQESYPGSPCGGAISASTCRSCRSRSTASRRTIPPSRRSRSTPSSARQRRMPSGPSSPFSRWPSTGSWAGRPGTRS